MATQEWQPISDIFNVGIYHLQSHARWYRKSPPCPAVYRSGHFYMFPWFLQLKQAVLSVDNKTISNIHQYLSFLLLLYVIQIFKIKLHLHTFIIKYTKGILWINFERWTRLSNIICNILKRIIIFLERKSSHKLKKV